MRFWAIAVSVLAALLAVSGAAIENDEQFESDEKSLADLADDFEGAGEMSLEDSAEDFEGAVGELAYPPRDGDYISEQELQEIEEYNAMTEDDQRLLMTMIEAYADDPEGLMKFIEIDDPFKDLGISGECRATKCTVTCQATATFKVFWHTFKLSASITGEYLPKQVGLRLTIKLNNREVYSHTVSARKGLEICKDVPGLNGGIQGCLKIGDIKVNIAKKQFRACLRMEVHVAYTIVASRKLSCISLHP